MAQNVTIAGASYSDVPSIQCPKTGGGTAIFTDVSDTTAAAADVQSGKYFYTAAGVKTAGTGSGGGSGAVIQDEQGYLILNDESQGQHGIIYPLYEQGDMGGWAPLAWASVSGFTAKLPTITYESNDLKIDQTSYHTGIAYRASKVDLTDYSTVTAHGTFVYDRASTSAGCGIYILSAADGVGYYSDVAVAKTELSVGTHSNFFLTVDVASLTGEYYVAFGSVITTHFTIDGVWCFK